MFFLIWFNITEYLWHKWPRICFVCRNHNHVPSSFITRVTRRVPLLEQELNTLLGHGSPPPPISGIFRHHWKEIEKNETLAKLLPEPPVVAFRRPKNTKDTLVRAAVSRPSSTVGQCKPCHKCSIARRQERSIRSFAMSIAKHLMWFTSLIVTLAGRNT